MPKRHQQLVTNYYYHIFNRGVNKRKIFKAESDYTRFLAALRYYQNSKHTKSFSTYLRLSADHRLHYLQQNVDKPKNINLIAFCCMPNHFHLLVQQKTTNGISTYMQKLQNSFTKYINTKHNRTGPLLQGPFKAILIDSDAQLTYTSKYIHRNLLSIMGDEEIQQTRMSSFKTYLTKENELNLKTTPIMEFFKNSDDYKEFVLELDSKSQQEIKTSIAQQLKL